MGHHYNQAIHALSRPTFYAQRESLKELMKLSACSPRLMRISNPDDNLDLTGPRRLAKRWAEENFADYRVAIIYHDDNENEALHAPVLVNNTYVRTDYRLQEMDLRPFRYSLRKIATEIGVSRFGGRGGPALCRGS